MSDAHTIGTDIRIKTKRFQNLPYAPNSEEFFSFEKSWIRGNIYSQTSRRNKICDCH